MPSDYAIHSDLLVYWTGAKDIEKDCKTAGWNRDNCPKEERENTQVINAYVERLTSILKYGLWMTNQSPPEIGSGSTLQEAPCSCFTELKLSQSQNHAARYGRLGLAFKRPFLFERGGRPVVYYSSKEGRWMMQDKFLHSCAKDLHDKRLMHFFQPMNSGLQLNYDLYSESEWRIVFDDQLCNDGRIVDPRNAKSAAFEYFNKLPPDQQNKLRYLIPVDGWLALIIYPTLSIKNIAQQPGHPIRALLESIKGNKMDHANQVEGGNFPVEIDLDLCRHF